MGGRASAEDPIINEYDEDSEPSEELFIVVGGRATFHLEGSVSNPRPVAWTAAIVTQRRRDRHGLLVATCAMTGHRKLVTAVNRVA